MVIRLDLGELRSSARASAVGGGVTFGGMALGASALVAVFAGLLWLPVGAAAAAGIGYGFTRKAVTGYRKQTALLEENVEGFLDRLEHDRPALPPPAS